MKGDLLNNDTIIAPITSLNGGSVHLIRISGENAIPFTNRFFSKDILESRGNRFFYGQLVNEQNKHIDNVVVFVYRKPHSYTGEDVVEISCHANIIITEKILELFIRQGCRYAEPGEFTKRAFLNGRMDLVQAESVAALIAAKSDQALENALNQLDGKFSEELKKIRKNIIDSLSLLELNLDFAEEDIEIINDREILKLLNQTERKISEFLKSYNQGKLLQNGVKVLITGKPNVGKSSLMNALLEKDRVLVSEIPGTTRDVIHDEIFLDNILVKFLDTAGIRYSGDHLEQEGVKRAKKLYREADIILMVFDLSQPFSEEDFDLLKLAKKYAKKTILVGNKIDLGKNPSNKKFFEEDEQLIEISAKKKKNIAQIKKAIKDKIHYSDTNELFLNNERQYKKLKEIRKAIGSARKALKNNLGHEFVSMELRQIIDILAELTGEVTNEDILNNIFSQFCIGK